MGQHPGVGAALPAAADGGVRRLRRARRRPGRQGDRRARPRSASATTRSSSTSGATTARAPKARTAASASCWRRTRSPTPIEQQLEALNKIGGLDALGGPKVDNMYHAGWAWAGDTPFQLHQADRLALRRHAQSAGDLLAGAHQAGQDAALAVPPRQRHRADDLRDPRHQAAEGGRRLRAGPDRRRQHGLHVRRREGARAQAHAVLRQQRQPRHLPRRLVRLHVRPADAVAHGEPGARDLGLEQGRLGALRPHDATSRRPTTSPRRSRSGWKR